MVDFAKALADLKAKKAMEERAKCSKHGCELIEEESEVWTGKFKTVLEKRTEWICPQCEATATGTPHAGEA